MPYIEQLSFEGVNPNPESQDLTRSQETQADLERLRAFGYYLKTDMYDVFGDYDLSEVTDSDKQDVSPNNLGRMFTGRDYKVDRYVVDRIALHPVEYKGIVRSPKALGESAAAGVFTKHEVDSEGMAASDRAIWHVLDQKLEYMVPHTKDMQARLNSIRILHKRAQLPGFAHLTHAQMKELFAEAWQEFQTILEVTSFQRGWTEDERQQQLTQQKTAMIHNLTQDAQSTRVKNWKRMLNLAENYLELRIRLFKNRINETSDRSEVFKQTQASDEGQI